MHFITLLYFAAWSHIEVKLLRQHFATFIDRKVYPPAGDIKSFMEKNKINRTVAVIKAKLQHLMKKTTKGAK